MALSKIVNLPRRMRKSTAYFTSLLFACIADVCLAQELDERWLLRECPDVIIDGSDSDWRKHDCAIDGVDTVGEKNCVANLQRGWTSDGLLCSAHIISDTANWDKGITVDIFADLRTPNANMAEYEIGVAHISLFVEPAGVSAKIKCGPNEERSLEIGRELQLKMSKKDNGLFVEALIPWTTVKGQQPERGDWIGFCTRIRLTTATGTSVILGADTEEEKNPIETTPIAFTPVKLAPLRESRHPQISFEAEETVLGKGPWLEIKVAALKSQVDLSGARMEIDSSVLGHLDEPFVTSAGGKCWVLEFKHILPLLFSRDASISFTIRTPKGTISWNESIAIPVLRRWQLIEETLPEESFAAVQYQQRSLGLMLKGCARECALLLSPNINDGRSVRKRARGIMFPGIYEDRIKRFERFATRAVHDGGFPDIFPYQAWCSQIDGEWLPYKVIRPWNPGIGPVVQLTLYGAKPHHSRAEMLESDIIAFEEGTKPSTYGDRNYVVMYERSGGNAGMDRESLQRFYRDVIPTFGGPDVILGIEGVSAGARSALQIALNYPDRFSFMRLASGLIPEYALFQAANLKETSVSLVVGELDTEVVESNRLFAKALDGRNVSYDFEIVPKTGHYFFPPGRSPNQSPKLRSKYPRTVSLETFTPSECNWLKLDQVATWGKRASLSGEILPSRIEIKVENAFSFTLRADQMPNVPIDCLVEINGKESGRISLSASTEITFALAPDGTYRRATRNQHPSLSKVAGCTGPARQIDDSPVTIVYGTRDSEFSHALRHRAIEIIRAHLGFGPRQVSSSGYVIMSDREAIAANLKGRNLWLVGNQEQNDYVLQMTKSGKLPSSLPDISNDPDALLSYIFPLLGEEDQYIYHEMGTTPLAYCSAVLAAPNHDICIQSLATGAATIKFVGNFNTAWSFRPKP